MSYTPTNWSAGDTVTSAKLNKMEQGIANAGGANILVAHCTMNGGSSIAPGGTRAASSNSDSIPNATLDVTLRQIMDADFTIVKMDSEEDGIRYGIVSNISYDNEENYYSLAVGFGFVMKTFYAESEDDYPNWL